MAKESKVVTEEKKEKALTPAEQMRLFRNANKGDHISDEEEIRYTTSTGSLIFDMAVGGGVNPGSLRALGIAGGGKTSFTLQLLKNFLQDAPKRMAIYYRSEGRLSEKIQKRSGVKFVTKPEEWTEGTCLIEDSNVYEYVFTNIKHLITDNPFGIQYTFIIDSADTLVRREDLLKPFEKSDQVAGGALITSTFYKKVGNALSKRGHRLCFIGQRRDFVKTDPRQKTPQRQGNASGSNSVQHQADLVVEFLQRTEFDGDLIRENPNDKTSKIIGHWAKLKIIKGDDENYEQIVKYPIKYGRVDGNSVWVEYEITDLLIMWEFAQKKGSWFTFTDNLRSELLENNLDIPEKVQGIDSIRALLEEKPELTQYLYNKFKSLLSNT